MTPRRRDDPPHPEAEPGSSQPDLRQKPEPRPEPAHEPADPHRAKLDNDEDGRYLEPSDERRRGAEARRGRPFDQDEIDGEIGYRGQR